MVLRITVRKRLMSVAKMLRNEAECKEYMEKDRKYGKLKDNKKTICYAQTVARRHFEIFS
jgi:hypothetical protein